MSTAAAGLAIVVALVFGLLFPVGLYLSIQSETRTERMDRNRAEQAVRRDTDGDSSSGDPCRQY